MKYSGKKQGIKYITDLENDAKKSIPEPAEPDFDEIFDEIGEELFAEDKAEGISSPDIQTDSEEFTEDFSDEEFAEEFYEDDYAEDQVYSDTSDEYYDDDNLRVALIDEDEEIEELPSLKDRIIKYCGIGTVAFQGIMSVILVVILAIINLLPDFVLILIIVILAILLGMTVLSQIIKFRTSKIRIIGAIVAFVLAILFLIVSLYLFRTNSLLNKVTSSGGSKVRAYNVAVLADDPAQNLKDAAGYVFGTQSSFNPKVYNQIMEEAANMAGQNLTVQDYKSAIEQAQALYDGKVKAIIYDNSFTSTIEEKHENFVSDIRVIAQIQIPETSTVEAVKVDVLKEPFIVFISGNDDFGEINTTGRSDVNMLVAVEPKSKQVLLITIPRDYYVTFPNVTGSSRDKLTHAGIYGVETLIASVENLFSCKINYYVQVNFSSCEEIIDAIGGITLYNEYEFTDKWGDTFPEGEITLNGEYALDYVRERYSLPDGDLGRGRHQQAVIEAVINKLTSTASMTNFGALANALEDFAITNMPKDQITNIIKDQLGSGVSWNVLKVQALGESMFQPSYAASGEILAVVMPYDQSVKLISALIAKLMSGQPLTDKEIEATWNFSDMSYYTAVVNVDDTPVPDNHDYEQEINAESAAPPVETTTAADYTEPDSVDYSDYTTDYYYEDPDPTEGTEFEDPDPTESTEYEDPQPSVPTESSVTEAPSDAAVEPDPTEDQGGSDDSGDVGGEG